ncbi:hypothetical protein BD410DRAFT_552544 [Rickenella mellea]|uniref:Uncharacterized protein n=1 Tax=Rickenella mellea TaxID=50990 RepID=A0A4Y7PPH7_9AGAM|nr:hypothetical protein BD410DRAFT_552544 [Rickenella mellea]
MLSSPCALCQTLHRFMRTAACVSHRKARAVLSWFSPLNYHNPPIIPRSVKCAASGLIISLHTFGVLLCERSNAGKISFGIVGWLFLERDLIAVSQTCCLMLCYNLLRVSFRSKLLLIVGSGSLRCSIYKFCLS